MGEERPCKTFALLFADMVRRKKWHLLALAVWVSFLAFRFDFESVQEPETAFIVIVLHGGLLCAVLEFLMASDLQGSMRVTLMLPMERARLSAFEWYRLIVVPPLLMTAVNLVLGVAWDVPDLPHLFAFIVPAVAAMGAFSGVVLGFYYLQARKVNVLGFWRSSAWLLLCAASLVLFCVIFQAALSMMHKEEGLALTHVAAIVAGIVLTGLFWHLRDSILEPQSGKWDGFFARKCKPPTPSGQDVPREAR